MFLYSGETKDSRVFPNDTITNFDPSMAGVQDRLYARRHTRHILYFFTMMNYTKSSETCQQYGGIMYTPRTKKDIMMLDNRPMHGYVGLHKSQKGWVDSAGKLFEEPSLWHIRNFGDCAKVKDGFLVDCKCSRLRKFVCDVLY